LETIFAILFLLSSIAIIAMPVKAQQNQDPNTAGGPLPSGVTPAYTYQDTVYLSFSPNPIGVGQTLLVNVFIIPPIGANRAHTGYTVTFTKPDGTKHVVGPFNSFVADGTNYFSYAPDQAGNWTVQFTYAGDYYPAGRYVNGILNNSAPAGSSFMDQRDYPSTYYEPAKTPVQTLVVQEQPVMSWYSPLPTDYWTRPISPDNREWSSIAGNFPWAYYNSIVNYCGPYVTAPNTAHIVWRQQEAVGGIIGGEAGQYSIQASAGTPSVIYLGRCYQTQTVPINGVPTSCAVCYDLQTGQQYYAIPVSQGGITPTAISYIAPATTSAQDLGTAANGETVDLINLSGGRLYKINAFTGAVTLNVSISPLTSGTFYNNNYVISVQTINSTSWRMINWTTAGTSTNFATRIVGNVSWPVSMAPGGTGMLADFDTGVAVGTVAGIFGSASGGVAVTGAEFGLAGGAYGTRIVGISMVTGQVLYNFTTDDTSFYPAADSVGDGKVFIPMDAGILDCFDLFTGKLVWTTTQFDYPWGQFGSYSAETAYGFFYWQTYDGVVAFNESTGQRAWKFQAPAPPFETPYTMSNGTGEYPFFGSAKVADGKLYTYNTEHTPSQPITRGWGLYCINATTGQGIWSVIGPMAPGAISDGYLTAGNSYDGYLYAFGKGLSSTSISVPQTELDTGHTAVISGSVLDQSPAQPGTPCVSAQSMGAWMDYLYMQQQVPANITGVPVSIDAVDPNGNFVHIATVASDGASGTFGYVWTPSIVGEYKITATFAGDDSYGSSWAQAYASVVQPASSLPTQTPTTAKETVSNSDLATYLVAGIIAIIVAIIIVGAILARKKA
jgi:hypothetical protein